MNENSKQKVILLFISLHFFLLSLFYDVEIEIMNSFSLDDDSFDMITHEWLYFYIACASYMLWMHEEEIFFFLEFSAFLIASAGKISFQVYEIYEKSFG